VSHLDGSPPTSSFPSGHTAASTTLYGVLAIIALTYAAHWAWRTLAIVLPVGIVLCIGLSRLYRGMHYPSDIVGAVILGLLWLTVVTTLLWHGQDRPARSRSTRTTS